MKRHALKAKQDCLFWSSAKLRKVFSKNNDSVNSSLQMWIIYHPRVIQYLIVNYYIAVNFDDGNIGAKNELRQKVLLQVSVRELHIEILKKYATGFSMEYDAKRLVHISDYAL